MPKILWFSLISLYLGQQQLYRIRSTSNYKVGYIICITYYICMLYFYLHFSQPVQKKLFEDVEVSISLCKWQSLLWKSQPGKPGLRTVSDSLLRLQQVNSPLSSWVRPQPLNNCLRAQLVSNIKSYQEAFSSMSSIIGFSMKSNFTPEILKIFQAPSFNWESSSDKKYLFPRTFLGKVVRRTIAIIDTVDEVDLSRQSSLYPPPPTTLSLQKCQLVLISRWNKMIIDNGPQLKLWN